MRKKKITVEGGMCLSCGSGSLRYDDMPEFNGDGMTIGFECRLCKFTGLEYYSIELTGVQNSETLQMYNIGDTITIKENK